MGSLSRWVGFASCYTRIVRFIESVREHRLAATYHPKVELEFKGSVKRHDGDDCAAKGSENVEFTVSLTNLAEVPLRIESVRTMLIPRENDTPAKTAAMADAHRLVSPHKNVEFDFAIQLPEGMSASGLDRRVLVQCCDLSGLSKYSLVISDRNKTVEQFVGFRAA